MGTDYLTRKCANLIRCNEMETKVTSIEKNQRFEVNSNVLI
jgi:hypothetical protein